MTDPKEFIDRHEEALLKGLKLADANHYLQLLSDENDYAAVHLRTLKVARGVQWMRSPENYSPPKKELEKFVRSEFAEEFGLKKSTRPARLAERLDDYFMRLTKEYLDHCSYWMRGENQVIVSQPYMPTDAIKEGLAEFVSKAGCILTFAPQYAWHAPGYVNCFLLEFPPAAVNLMRNYAKFRKTGLPVCPVCWWVMKYHLREDVYRCKNQGCTVAISFEDAVKGKV